MEGVFAADDPLWGVHDMEAEGIETRFVIPAALLLALRALERTPASALRYLVEETIAIGGDPDTIGSISVGVTGACLGEPLSREIDAVLSGFEFDPSLIPPFLDTSAG
jgi:ADP-ribosylglycohydrolase